MMLVPLLVIVFNTHKKSGPQEQFVYGRMEKFSWTTGTFLSRL